MQPAPVWYRPARNSEMKKAMSNNPFAARQPRQAGAQAGGRTPDMQVATEIVALHEVQGLICPEQSDGVRTRIASGELDAADWVAIAQRAIALEPCDAGTEE